MNMRPRYHKWLPLATQQMRLRNLIRIQGLNIYYESTENEDEALIYYSLHHTKDDLAFYTSEMLPCRDTKLQWAEINCEQILKSNANCVCIKVWAHVKKASSIDIRKETWNNADKNPISEISKKLSVVCLSPQNLLRPPDKLLFKWGVYFSGLMLLNTEIEFKCRKNSLIFQINDNFFAVPEYFTPESLRDQLSAQHQIFSANVPKDIAIGNVTNVLDGNFINSPHTTPKRGNSPSSDWHQELLRMSKQRYEVLYWPVTDVRKSYNIEKLLRLQNLQRQHKERLQESEELRQEIKQLSVRCITPDQLLCKPRRTSYSSSPRYSHHSGMGRVLTELLADEQVVSPQTLLKAQTLAKQVETLRAKKSLLLSGRDTYVKRNQQLQEQLNELRNARYKRSKWLADRKKELLRDENKVKEQKELVCEQKHKRRCIVQHLEQRMSTLCLELRKIYPIASNPSGFYTICNIAFPNMERYINDGKYASSIIVDNVSPMGLSAALGYVAHLVQIISIVINQPLRNPIIHEGSRSRIIDIIREIPYSSREFPLFTRSTIPSNAVKRAICLLNQNITQLCYDITGVGYELHGTIKHLMRIFATFAKTEQMQQMSGDLPELIEETQKSLASFNKHSYAHINLRHSRLTLLSYNRNPLLSNNGMSNSNNAIDQFTENGNIGDNININKSSSCSNTNNKNVDEDVPDSSFVTSLSQSRFSEDMNYVPMIYSSSSTSTATTTTDNIAEQMALQNASGSPRTIIDNGSNIVTQQRICRSVGSYSDYEEDHLKPRIDQENLFSNSDSNINFYNEHI